jgi:hypothetical protein
MDYKNILLQILTFDKKQTALLTIVARRGAIRPSGEEI